MEFAPFQSRRNLKEIANPSNRVKRAFGAFSFFLTSGDQLHRYDPTEAHLKIMPTFARGSLENGKTLTVESSQSLIAQEEHNLVYRQAF